MRANLTKNCYYCGRLLGHAEYGTSTVLLETIDHIIPVSKGGGNEPSNLVISCHQCNGLKSNHTLPYFIKVLQTGLDKETSRIKGIPVSRFAIIIQNCNTLIANNLKSTNTFNYGVILASKKKKRTYEEKVQTLVAKNKVAAVKKENTLKQAANRLREKTISDNRKAKFNAEPLIPKFSQPLTAPELLELSKNLYLQKQTVEQFRLAKKHGWLVARALTEPEPDFHFKENQLRKVA